MKKILLVLALLALLATPAFAEVRLTWDAYSPEVLVDLFQVEVDGQIVADVVPNEFVIVSLAGGAHIARVRAHNPWGWSEFSAAFDFVSGVPDAPVNIRLELGP